MKEKNMNIERYENDFFFLKLHKEIYPIYIIPRKKGCNYINYSAKKKWGLYINYLL